jgi:membrane protein implicated in regulation of membrane protease activity
MILPITLVMYGLGIFVSGGVVDFKPLLVGGLVAWAGSVIAFFQPYTVQLLLVSVVVLVSYIVPGHMLRNISKKQA